MKASIISTIVATLLAASSAAPFDTPCQYQTDSLRQHQIDVLPQFITVKVQFCAGPEPTLCFNQEFPADHKLYPISKFILSSLFLCCFFTAHQLEKTWEFLTADTFLFTAHPLPVGIIYVEGITGLVVCDFITVDKQFITVGDNESKEVIPRQRMVAGRCVS
jgi:hypothetical protein